MRMEMEAKIRDARGAGRQEAFWLGVTRAIVLLLLCAVPVLSTLAKDSIYLPQSNTAHFINIAAKMKVVDAGAPIIAPQLAEPCARLMVSRPAIRITRQDQLEVPAVAKVSLTICLQHRSPPPVLA